MKFEIKHRWSGEILFSVEADNWRFAVEAAIRAKANLTSADLRYANLTSADLRYANLTSADLRYADLTYANLTSANLTSANLTSADLTYANLTSADLTSANLTSADLTSADLTSADLTYANLTSADLTSANLTSANLTSANLRSANLTSANLTSADLTSANLTSADLTSADLDFIRNDFWSILLFAQAEVSGLRKAIVDGKIDGSVYEGECACLVGTIANIRKCKSTELTGNLERNSSRPAERFFMAIKPGDTPETNFASKIALEWLDTFVEQTK